MSLSTKQTEFSKVLLLGCALTFLFFFDFYFQNHYLFDFDVHNEFLPLKNFIFEELSKGRIPYWNPYSGAGLPLLADGHAGTFYPLNVVLYFFRPLYTGLVPFFQIHQVMAFIGVYYFAKAHLRTQKYAFAMGIFSAIAFAFSGGLIAILTNYFYALAISYIPLQFYFLDRLFKKERIKDGAFLCLSLAFPFFIGAFPYVLLSIVMLAFYAIGRHLSEKKRPSFKFLSKLFASGILFTLLISAQLLPTLEYIGESRFDGGSSVEYLGSNSLSPALMTSMAIPHIWGVNDQNNKAFADENMDGLHGYFDFDELHNFIGLSALLLSILGALFSRTKGKVLIMFMAFVPMFFSLGANVPGLVEFFAKVPFLNNIKDPQKWFVFGSLFLCVLAGLGLKRLTEGPKLKELALSLFSALFLTFLALYFSKNFSLGLKNLTNFTKAPSCSGEELILSCLFSNVATPLVQSVVVVLVIILIYSIKVSNRVKASLFSVLVFLELFFSESSAIPRTSKSFYTKDSKAIQRAKELSPRHRFMDGIATEVETLNLQRLGGDTGLYHRVPTFTTTTPFLTKESRFLFDFFDKEGVEEMARLKRKVAPDILELMAALGLGGIIKSNNELESIEGAYQTMYFTRNYKKYEGENVLKAYLEACFDGHCDRALLEKTVGDSESSSSPIFPQSIEYSSQKLTAKILAPTSGLFVSLDQHYPGWTCKVNGVEKEVLRVNGMFKGVLIEKAGEYKIEFIFLPIRAKIGQWLSLFGILLLLLTFAPKRYVPFINNSRI